MPQLFDEQFKSLTGNGPYPWQCRLYDALVANEMPESLDIPTGLGKTSVMAIWLLAQAVNDALPRRLVYVVNRRAIVDQASALAAALAEKRTDLSVSTLRGALADNRAWMRRPDRPAIVVGTVDMIGSRLLFDAYRAGRWSKAMHAGLLGQDALIVHDEAHLSPAFQALLKWIERCQKGDRSPRPLRTLAMSATGQDGGGGGVLRIDDRDRAMSTVARRIGAVKRLRVHDVATIKLLPETLAAAAFARDAAGPTPRRVIVFAQTPATAKRVADLLRDRHKVDASRIALLTGTIRGYERDRLASSPVLARLLNSTTPEHTEYLVSTSAGEVGADFDADDLVTDLTTLDSMIQRLGRVNRRGDGDARVDVFAVAAPAKTDHQARMLLTVDWLRALPPIADDPDGRLDASPATLGSTRENDRVAYVAAASEIPAIVTPHPATLDAWAMTSISDDWPVAPPLDAYLHGVGGYEPPRTSLAWRAELERFFPKTEDDDGRSPPEYDAGERERQFKEWIERCPLRPREMVADKSDDVIATLATLAGRKGNGNAVLAILDRGRVTFETLAEFAARAERYDKRFPAMIAERTILLPPRVGGLDANGMLDASATHAVPDVADAVDADSEADETQRRCRVWLDADDDGDLSPRWLGRPGGLPKLPDLPESATPNAAAWRDVFQRHKTLSSLPRSTQTRLSVKDRLQGVLLLFKPASTRGDGKDRVRLIDHQADAGTNADAFAGRVSAEWLPAVSLAAACHDYGKASPWWQASVGNSHDAEPLAKSFGAGMNPRLLAGYRHEFGSLLAVMNAGAASAGRLSTLADHRAAVAALGADERDLFLHLIAAHHGRGRPLFDEGAFDPDDRASRAFGDALSPGEIARRYARLQRRFGHWGLAWLESLVKAADHAASAGLDTGKTS